MTCSDVLDRVEAMAAGDWEPDPPTRAHLETCGGCAGALATARQVEAALAKLPQPHVPAQFTATVLQRVRREQWKAEERVDRLFNISIAVALVLMIGGVAALFNLGELMALAGAGWRLAASSATTALAAAAPSLGIYMAAAALLMTAAAMWWWAERRLTL